MATTYHPEPIEGQPTLAPAGKIGAALFAFWGILHMWVGYEGTMLYFKGPAKEQWRFFAGGLNAPLSALQLPTDPVTIHVHTNFILNCCYHVFG